MLASRVRERAVVEREVLAVVSALVDELGSRPGARPVALDEAIDRDLGLGSLERVAVGAPLLPAGDGWPAMVRLRDQTRSAILRRSGEAPVERA